MSNSESLRKDVRTQSENATGSQGKGKVADGWKASKSRSNRSGGLYTPASSNPVRDERRDAFSRAAIERDEANYGADASGRGARRNSRAGSGCNKGYRANASTNSGSRPGSRDMAPLVKEISPLRRAVNAFFAFVLTIGLGLPTTALSAVSAWADEGNGAQGSYPTMPLANVSIIDNLWRISEDNNPWYKYRENDSKYQDIVFLDQAGKGDSSVFSPINYEEQESYASYLNRAFTSVHFSVGNNNWSSQSTINGFEYSASKSDQLTEETKDNGKYYAVYEIKTPDIYQWGNSSRSVFFEISTSAGLYVAVPIDPDTYPDADMSQRMRTVSDTPAIKGC